MSTLPDVKVLAGVADQGSHPAIRRWRPEDDRLAALEEELRWWVEVAARDLTWARDYQSHAPQSGAPPERYLERWTEVTPDLGVLWGPRYRARDPDTPFIGLTASSRPVSRTDVAALIAAAREGFAEFTPGYLNLWTADPAGTWPGTRADSRLLAAPLGELRTRPVPGSLTVHPATDLDFYPRYVDLQEQQFRADPAHRLHTPAARPGRPSTLSAWRAPYSRSASTAAGPGSSPVNPPSATACAGPSSSNSSSTPPSGAAATAATSASCSPGPSRCPTISSCSAPSTPTTPPPIGPPPGPDAPTWAVRSSSRSRPDPSTCRRLPPLPCPPLTRTTDVPPGTHPGPPVFVTPEAVSKTPSDCSTPPVAVPSRRGYPTPPFPGSIWSAHL